jgi:hypothetical protein
MAYRTLNTIFAALLGVLAFHSQPAAAISTSNEKVVLIYSASGKGLSLPTLSFYKSVAGQFAASNNWQVVPFSEVDRFLPKAKSQFTLTSVPSISRSEFLKAHPMAAGNTKKKGRKKGGLAPSLQELLDTLAVQGAVVVDCVPSGRDRVRACGLYYYDRSAGRVVAAMRKDFRVGITDATRWSDVMVAGLHSGLVAARDSKSKAQLETILDKAEDRDDTRKFAAHLEVKGESSFQHDGSPAVAPAFGLGLASMANGSGLGLELGVSEQRAESGDDTQTLWTGKRAGIFMTSEVEALETLLWSLDVGLGASVRRFALRTGGIETGAIAQREAYLTARPGLLWNLSGSSVRMGFVGDFTRYVGGNSRSSDELTGKSLPVWSRGLSFRLKYVF